MMIINTNTGLSGEYKFDITKPDGSISSSGWIKNLILDIGLDKLGGPNTAAPSGLILAYCRVGTGASTPIASQTALDSQLASQLLVGAGAISVINSSAPLYESTHTYQYIFAQGAIIGTLTEVGIGWAATGATLFSRAKIIDSNGNPTTLTLVALDQLTIYYRLKVSPPITDSTGILMISGTSYDYMVRLGNANTFAAQASTFYNNANGVIAINAVLSGPPSSVLGAITGLPTGTASETPAITYSNYVPGTFFRDISITWVPSQGVWPGGTKTLTVQSGTNCYFQYSFTPVIPKTNTNTLIIVFRYSWNRT